MASTSSNVSSTRYGTRLAWVCSTSHGQRWRSVRASWCRRTPLAATGAPRRGTYTHVRWSASMPRSSSLHVVCTIASSAVPSRWRTTTGSSPLASSTASLMSDRTQSACVWAISSGPADPAAAAAKSWPSTSWTPTSTGSMPSRAQATSRNDSAGRTSTATRSSARSSSTRALEHQRGARHGVQHLAVLDGRRHQVVDDARVDVGEPFGVLVPGVERRGPVRRGGRSDAGRSAGSGAGSVRWP